MFPDLPAEPWTGETVRNWLHSDQALGYFRQYSGNAIIDAMRDAGMRIREQTFFDIRREMLGLGKWQEQIQALRPESLIPLAWMDDTPYPYQAHNAVYKGTLLVYDPETGERIELERSIGADVQLTKGELDSIFAGLFTALLEQYNYIVEDVGPTEVYRIPGAYLPRPEDLF